MALIHIYHRIYGFMGQIIPHYRYRSHEKVQTWLEKMGIENYSIEDNLTVNVAGDVRLCRKKLFFLPVVFGRVDGTFNINENFLKTLAGCPNEVTGEFYCNFNRYLTTLKGGPSHVGSNYYCYNSALLNLEGIPQTVHGVLNCSNNRIRSLKHAPQWIERIFICPGNPITDFNAYQFSCGEEFHCTHSRENRIEALSEYYVKDDLMVPAAVFKRFSLHETLHGKMPVKPSSVRKTKI